MSKKYVSVISGFILALGLCAIINFQNSSAMAESGNRKEDYTPEQVKTLKNWTYSLALDAATWGSPAVIMYNLRALDAFGSRPKAAPNSIWRMEDISTPELSVEAGYVTPNVNVIYGFGFLDLEQEPIILTAPDSHGRYYMVEIVDMYTNAFAYVGGTVTGYKGGKFALVGPGFKGKLPDDVKIINCPTRWVLIQPRVRVFDKADLPAAREVLQDIKVEGLAKHTDQPAPPAPEYHYLIPKVTDSKQPASAMNYEDPLQFWEILSAVINENPPPADQVTALLPYYRSLGIELGKSWDRSKLNPTVVDAMRQAATDIGPMLSNLPTERIANGWFMPPPTIGNSQTDYKTRAVVARVGLTANVPSEAIYYLSTVDSSGNQFDGTKQYTITFQKTPPFIAPGFWSLTMYDATNNYTVPNPINRYFLGSDTGMKTNKDGSLTIYIQQKSPGTDKESNWLPAPPKPFYLILRSYAPAPAMIESLSGGKGYIPPPVVETK
jgi:DNA sulfur modification protein DndE